MRIFSIILADDEQQILYGMKKGIEWEKLGFRVAGVAQNGKEALELMEEVHPDLVISDIKMPFMDGLELAKHIHEDYMNTKVILFSGWDDFEYARLAISYGVSEYIMKPINYEEMQNLLMKMHEELDKEYNEKMNRARLEHAYMESLPLLRQQFFTRLVTEKMNKNELQSQIDNLKLEFTDAVYSVVAMKVGRGDEKDVLSELAVKQTIKEALEKITRVYEFGMSDNEIFILGSNKKHDVGRITRTIDEAVVLIERIFQSRISCGISVSREKIEDMPSLYEQALEALDYNLVTVEESYTYYNDIMPVQDVKEDWNTKVENIGKNITHYTEEELKSQVESLLAWLHRRQYSLNEYQVLILEISFSFSRFYKKYQITSDMEFAGTKKMAVKILSLSTGEELDHWLVNYCELIRSLIQKKQIDNNVILAEHARKIVEERFPDPDLSVETVCGELHVSSSYFSKIFKQETGGTFVNYLTGRRMEEAKKLLLQTDYKSQVIGNMVGYPEPNYFSYVFKKNCGMSPVKYRKQGEMRMKDKKVSIRIVFPFVMSVSIAVCIISCMFLFSHYFSGYFQRDTIEKVSKQKKTLSQDLEAEIENINELINSIYYQDIRTYDTATEMFQREMEQRMVRESEVLYSAAIYDAYGSSLWHSEKLPDRNKAEVKQEDWFQNAQKNIETIHYGEKKLVQPDKARYVYEISRYIEYVENGNMKSGVLLLEYYTDSIDEVLLHYKSQKSAYCYLLDTNRRLLYHPFEKEIVSGMYQEKTVKEAMACKNYKIEEQSGGKWLIERQQIGYTGWNVVLVNSMSSLDFESYNLHYVAWFTLLLVGVILIFLDILLFRSFTDPVYRLLQTMQEFGKGNYDIKAKEEGIGELKNLSAHFNIMADKLQEQMEEIRRNERERQQMEKKLLQSQINPHFLYNTLDSIIWMIRSEEYEGAGKMVSLLAKFFRISLSQGKDMIPLEKELEHASSYLAIQNIRFKDKFEFQIEADPALLKYLCPKLSIQPLLENAIYHGMEGMYEDGEITIRIYDRDGDIGIDVADNGPGMTQETIDHIMHNKVISSKRGSGIGVRNVNERIQLIYGEDYGVIITSELDEGTTATITIPKMEETDDAR